MQNGAVNCLRACHRRDREALGEAGLQVQLLFSGVLASVRFPICQEET